MSPEFRETEDRSLCDRFGLNFRALKHEYTDFKKSRGDVRTPGIKLLKNCISTLPVSTVECKRGFSKINVICSNLTSKPTVSHVYSLTFVSLCGPPV